MSLPLPALTFYRMPDQNPASADIQGVLDALYAGLNSATDYRGTSLPSTHLWTWAKAGAPTVTVYASAAPSGTPMTKTPQLIWCGTTAGPSLTMASPDASGTASVLYMGINKNGGAYNAYTAASPFTSGSFFGYWKAHTVGANATGTIVRCFISQETVFVQIVQPTVTNQNWMHIGAIIEPYDADTTNSGETDNRLYGMCCSGTNNSTTFLSAKGTASWMEHGTTASNTHCGFFTPGAGTLIVGGRRNYLPSAPTANSLQTPSGVYVADIPEFGKSSATTVNDGNRFGTFRGIYVAGSVQSGRYLRSGGTDLYHFVAMDTTTAAQGIMLPAAA